MTWNPPTSSPPGTGSDGAAVAHRCGYVALVGRPNAGKSTLFNALVGQRLSIVTPKPQTTRSRILGILTRPGSQVILLDTPGLLEPEYRLHQTMERQIEQAARQADLALLLLDATRPLDRQELVRRFLDGNRLPVLGLLNKCDLLETGRAQEECGALAVALGLPEVWAISALRGDNLDLVLQRLEALLPAGPPLYPEEMVAEQPERFFVAELVREACFGQLEDELPYALTVTIEEFREQPGKTYVKAVLHVERESQKGIVIGQRGNRLRAIGTAARAQVEELLGTPVYLDLWVKVRPGWRRKDKDLKEFGYL
ncbi:MAG: GTPase Era [Candidatus Latescibacterota bacterium]